MEAWQISLANIEGQIATLKDEIADQRKQLEKHAQKDVLEVIQSHLDTLRHELGALQQSVAQSDSEIDALQIISTKASRPFFLDATVIISTLALIFSFGTTAVSYYRTLQQDIHDSRAELRGFLQRLNGLARENVEVLNNPDKVTASQLSAFNNAETTLIAQQAAEVMKRIPNHVSPVEYNLVGNVLSTRNANQAEELYRLALNVSKSFDDIIPTLRGYATLRFANGDYEGGREFYRKALNVQAEIMPSDQNYISWTNAYTELLWAQTEAAQRQCAEAQVHIKKSLEINSGLPRSSGSDFLSQQITVVENTLESCK